MDSLKPIPTPPSLRWREFRVQALPILTFMAVVICAVMLWQRYVYPSNIVAQVETTTANIISTEPAELEQLHVVRFQVVKKGDPIATVRVISTNLAMATLETVRADLGLLQTRINVSQVRAEQAYERERLALLEQRVQLNEDMVNLKRWTVEYQRLKDLSESPGTAAVSSNDVDIAKYTMEALQVRVKEMGEFLKERERVLPSLKADTNTLAAIDASVAANRKFLETESASTVLRAPFDGVITVISNRPGEQIMGGAPIAVITGSEKPERIIAYMRQPITDMPKPGDTIQVRRRAFKRQTAIATIQHVGTQLEPIAPALTSLTATTLDLGLPFAISVPPDLNLLPGEVVDVIYNPKTAHN